MTLRQTADAIGRSPSFLSDVENGRRLPSDEVLIALSGLLELDLDDLLAAVGRVSAEVGDYLRKNPEAGRLFRALTTNRVDRDGVRRLIDEVASRPKTRSNAPDRQR